MLYRGGANLVSLFRGGDLAQSLEPWMRCDDPADLPFEKIAAEGAKAVLFDLENTLIPPGGPFTDDGREIVARARAAGLLVGVVSNASASWVKTELDREGIPFVAPAGKPGPQAFLKACAVLGIDPSDAVYAGDQMITDVLGSQRVGMRAILLRPRYTDEPFSARFQRAVVRVLLKLMGR